MDVSSVLVTESVNIIYTQSRYADNVKHCDRLAVSKKVTEANLCLDDYHEIFYLISGVHSLDAGPVNKAHAILTACAIQCPQTREQIEKYQY